MAKWAHLSRQPNQWGMTLVEVLVSLVILALLAVSLGGIFSTSQVWIAKGGKRVQAADYASSIIETIRAQSSLLNGLTLTGNPPSFTYKDDDLTHTSFTLPGGFVSINDPLKMQEQVTISQFMTDNNNLYKIKVTVSWTRGGQTQSVNMSSVVAAR